MRRTPISRADAIALIASAREAVCEKGALAELMNDHDAPSVFDALSQAYAGVSNGFLAEVCAALLGDRIEVVGEVDVRFPCPCCGRRTLTELHDPEKGTGYDICDYCGWEDDGTTSEEVESSVNRGSMAQYRARIREDANYYFRDKWPM